MDEQNKQEQQNNAKDSTEAKQEGSHGAGQEGSRPHVHLFGAEVNGGSGDWSRHASETKEDWRKRKDEWKQAHREQREQWKMQHRAWHDDHHHGGGIFWGMIVLFAGVVALLYTMGFISQPFWYAIAPFWPILLIMWGASIILGRHWFARFILFLFALVVLIVIIFYGLAKVDSPLVSWVSPHVVSAIQNTQPQQY